MISLKDTVLESNKNIHINFEAGNLSSNSGLFLFSEFCHKIGLNKILNEFLHVSSKCYRKHSKIDNLKQRLFQIVDAYYEDDRTDHLTHNPIITAVLSKESLASQPIMSRFFNNMTEDTLEQFNEIFKALRKVIYSIEKPNLIIFDLDSTLLNTYSNQEGHARNFHHQDKVIIHWSAITDAMGNF